MVQPWVFHDPSLAETWAFPVNPNRMTTPHGSRSLTVVSVFPTGGMSRVIEGNPEPFDWTVSGYIRTEQHYADLLYWSRKVNRLELSDHFARTWLVRVQHPDINEVRPTATKPWRFNYDLKLLNYGRLS